MLKIGRIGLLNIIKFIIMILFIFSHIPKKVEIGSMLLYLSSYWEKVLKGL